MCSYNIVGLLTLDDYLPQALNLWRTKATASPLALHSSPHLHGNKAAPFLGQQKISIDSFILKVWERPEISQNLTIIKTTFSKPHVFRNLFSECADTIGSRTAEGHGFSLRHGDLCSWNVGILAKPINMVQALLGFRRSIHTLICILDPWRNKYFRTKCVNKSMNN